jgi:hypothetical protein
MLLRQTAAARAAQSSAPLKIPRHLTPQLATGKSSLGAATVMAKSTHHQLLEVRTL